MEVRRCWRCLLGRSIGRILAQPRLQEPLCSDVGPESGAPVSASEAVMRSHGFPDGNGGLPAAESVSAHALQSKPSPLPVLLGASYPPQVGSSFCLAFERPGSCATAPMPLTAPFAGLAEGLARLAVTVPASPAYDARASLTGFVSNRQHSAGGKRSPPGVIRARARLRWVK